jgi:recombination protein RecA
MPDAGGPRRAAALPTGFANLDRGLGIGGFPRGRIVEIFGPAASGKTALALSCVAHLQREGGAGAWIDAEHVFDPLFAQQLGIDVTALPIAEPASAEDAFEIARRFALSGALELVVIDSAAALAPQLELAALETGGGSLQSRVLGSGLRRLSAVAARSGVCLLFLNQTRFHLGTSAPASETSAGGPSLKLHAAVRIALAVHGTRVIFRVVKNKCGAAFASGELDCRPLSGAASG